MKVTYFLIASVCFLITGCGKYGPPLPPEAFSPQPVKYLQAVSTLQGIQFSWLAPDDDLRGKELKSINGYRVYRKELKQDSDILDKEIEFEEIASVADDHINIRDQLREAAKQAGKPARRIKAPAESKQFSFIDSQLIPGSRYLYKIVPVNQGTVEGSVDQYIEILFRGESSIIKSLTDLSTEQLHS